MRLLLSPEPVWALPGGADRDVVVATRARLARNLDGFSFPHHADDRARKQVANAVRQAARADADSLTDLSIVEIGALEPRLLQSLVSSQRVSPALASDPRPERWAFLDTGGALSVLVNEEDHLRIQAIAPGLGVDSVSAEARATERKFGATLRYARTDRLGFLTTSLSNLGTGFRISLWVHLPALGRQPETAARWRPVAETGLVARGVFGERSETNGDLFQLSNAVSFGRTTDDLAARISGLASHVVGAERDARVVLASSTESRTALLLQARAATVALSAETLSRGDALHAISTLRLAVRIGEIPVPSLSAFDDTRFFRALAAAVQGSDNDADRIKRAARVRAIVGDYE